MPGDGQFELERFVSTLRNRGWDGVVSVEVLNKDLRALPVDESRRWRTHTPRPTGDEPPTDDEPKTDH